MPSTAAHPASSGAAVWPADSQHQSPLLLHPELPSEGPAVGLASADLVAQGDTPYWRAAPSPDARVGVFHTRTGALLPPPPSPVTLRQHTANTGAIRL